MIYFICWVVFLVVCTLAVLIAAVLENRNRDRRFDESTGGAGDESEAEPTFEDGEVFDATEPFEPTDDFEAVDTFTPDDGQAADDFAAFDKEFK